LDERDVINAWRELFRGKGTTPETLATAEALLSSLSGESPLHLRLANELEELKKGPTDRKQKRTSGRQAT
jgi:hypothetical protein